MPPVGGINTPGSEILKHIRIFKKNYEWVVSVRLQKSTTFLQTFHIAENITICMVFF